ncbi:aldehyde dehydrogenase (NADP(+)) [Rhizobium tumorigenes]|uniref:aldehyde dehydrogenase (NADP(+)) n=1 Tax=Rhizobium tumorigenes TaxID=2041385 RepID=UPI00241E2B13|nr:aldehyde dehydrogenase (NADP(+)) [Rhizobium tumorigenes]WFS00214.1 aldehyde dehydrogenase (NADP(+)) [Rhizobium tumorigenes]
MTQAFDIKGDLLIGADSTGDNRTVRAINPATGENMEPAFAVASVADVDRACDLAAVALDTYRSVSLEARAVFLETIAANILEIGDQLLERAHAETGLPLARLTGERGRTVGQLRLFASVVRAGEWLDLRIDPALPQRQPLPRPDLRLRQIPLGPVAVFGASNFPLAFSVAGGDTASALAAGCPVVVKGHLAHPGTGELVGRAIRAAVASCGLPEGVFSLVTGANETGAALVKNPHIKAVGFTGSRAGGLALAAIAAARPEPIPVYAEMSSVNPVYLLPAALGARAEALGKAFVGSLTMGAGQFCTNPGLMFAVDGPDLDTFIAAATGTLTESVPSPMLTPGIHAAYDKGVAAFAGNEAVKTVAHGKAADGANRSPAIFFETDAEHFMADESLGNEVFGAASLLVHCKDVAQMVAIAEKLEGQLTATLHLDPADHDDARKLLPVLERKVGRILANGWPTGVEVSHAMVHGGPFPATSDSRTTSVGTMAIRRYLRPVSYQDLPDGLLPPELSNDGVKTLPHLLDGVRAGK